MSTSRHSQSDASTTSFSRRALVGGAVAGSAALLGTTGMGSGSAAPFSARTPNLQASGAAFRTAYPNFPTLDPHVVSNGMWILTAAIMEGLVKIAASGTEAEAAAAESWEVSADGTVYTFKLRAAKWSNGDPVTAQDFEWTWQRLLTPQGVSTGVTLGANTYQPICRIVGATDFLAGALTDWSKVGIKAVDDATLQITTEVANAEFPMLLTHPSMVPLHRASVEANPDTWGNPGTFVCNGPFIPNAWEVNSSMTMIPNEQYWDRANVQLGSVELNLTEGAAANTAAVSFEADEIDIVALPLADLVRYQADPNLASMLLTVQGGTVGYLATLRSKNPLFEDVNMRKAISTALDRDTIAGANPATRPGWQLLPNSLVGWSDANNTPNDVDGAKQLLTDAGYSDGDGFPEVSILFGGTTANVQLEALADTLGKALNINVKLDMVEAGVYVERRWSVQEDNYVGFYFGTFGSTPTWSTWAANLWGPEFIQQFSLKSADWAEYQTIQNDQSLAPADRSAKLKEILATRATPEALAYGDKVNEAFINPDAEQQRALLQEAATIRQETYLILPLYYADGYYAVKANVTGVNLLPGGLAYYFKTIRKDG